MGNYRTTYIELDDFRVSCIQGYPYEGFVIGCGYAYVENLSSEMAILENSSYIYNPIKVQQIDTSLLAIIKSLHLTPDDIRKHSINYKFKTFIYNNSDCHYEPNSFSRYYFVEPICCIWH